MTIFRLFIFAAIWGFGFFYQIHAQDLSIEEIAGLIQDDSDPLDQLLTQIDQESTHPLQLQTQPSSQERTPCGTLVCDEQVIERILRAFLSKPFSASHSNFSNSLPSSGNQNGHYEKKMLFIPYQAGTQVNLAASSGFLPPRASNIMSVHPVPQGCPCAQNGTQMGNVVSVPSQYAPMTPPINQMFFQMPCGANNQNMPMEGYPYSAASIFDCINGCVGKLPPKDPREISLQREIPSQQDPWG